MDEAACKGQESKLWFADSDGAPGMSRMMWEGFEKAKLVCAQCPVSAECLDYALTHRIQHGIWGGKSEKERRRLVRSKCA